MTVQHNVQRQRDNHIENFLMNYNYPFRLYLSLSIYNTLHTIYVHIL